MGIKEQMEDFENKGKLVINPNGSTIYEILGYDNPVTMLKDSYTNQTVGAFVALDSVMNEMGAYNMFLTIMLVQMTTGAKDTIGIGDIIYYLYQRFNEEELVELVGRTIQARNVYDEMKGK